MPQNLFSRWLVVLLAGLADAVALAPGPYSDKMLARQPVIVLAQWEKAPFTWHKKTRVDEKGETHVQNSEAHTTLRILRVIKGLEPGAREREILLDGLFGWNKNGKDVRTWTSTEIPGNVRDVTKPALWFLRPCKSWDRGVTNDFLKVVNYRAIQPAVLEGYFTALGSRQPRAEVPKLLPAKHPLVTERVLYFLAGGEEPWPYDSGTPPDEAAPEKSGGRPLAREHPRVWSVVEAPEEGPRPYATALYAAMRGARAAAQLEGLLSDRNPDVRGVAAAWLLRLNRKEPMDKIVAALGAIRDDGTRVRLLDDLDPALDDRLVPLWLGQLHTASAYFPTQYGDATLAEASRKRLHDLTGYWFPYHPALANEGWALAVRERGKEERLRALEQWRPNLEVPLRAEILLPSRERDANPDVRRADHSVDKPKGGTGEEVAYRTIRVRNVSNHPIRLSSRPSGVDQEWPDGSISGGFNFGDHGAPAGPFHTLPPSQVLEFPLSIYIPFLEAAPGARKLKIRFLGFDPDDRDTGWRGELEVTEAGE